MMPKSIDSRWATAIGLITIFITIYFSIKAETSKALTITYSSKRALLTENTNSGPKIEITSNDKKITQPWLISVTVANTGSMPIEAKDIEAPLTLSFTNSKIINSEITDKTQPAISASIRSPNEHEVILEHKLLNPSDSISFDILLDGEPTIPPNALCRISGISAPTQIIQAETPSTTTPWLVQLPKPINILLLLVPSVIALILALASLLVPFAPYFETPKRTPVLSADKILKSSLETVKGSTRKHQLILTYISPNLSLECVRSSQKLASVLVGIPEAFLKSIDYELTGKTMLALHEDILHELRKAVATELYIELPGKIAQTARDAMKNVALDIDEMATCIESYSNIRPPIIRKPSAGDVAGAIFCGLLAMCIIQYIGAAWLALL